MCLNYRHMVCTGYIFILHTESPSLIQILSGKNVQFVDLSRLPKKYRDRVVGQLQTRKEKLEAERLERVEEARRQVCEGGGGWAVMDGGCCGDQLMLCLQHSPRWR